MTIDPIDVEWGQKYLDQLIELAKRLDPGPMRDATLLRIQHVMDFVEAWKEHRHGVKAGR